MRIKTSDKEIFTNSYQDGDISLSVCDLLDVNGEYASIRLNKDEQRKLLNFLKESLGEAC